MQAKAKTLAVALATLFVAACSGSSNSPRAVPAEPARNNDGSIVTAIITARFDPATGVVPFPNNLLLSGTTDLTLNPPLTVPGNPADPRNAPALALSALDGFSTVAPMSFTLSAAPRATSLTAGGPSGAIRVFEVLLTGPGGGVTSVVRELTSPAEFVAAPSSSNPLAVGIVPTAPLKPLTSYMVIVTDGVTDAAGNNATPDQAYFLAKRTSPLCVNGQSTDPLLPTANACALRAAAPADQLAPRRGERPRHRARPRRAELGGDHAEHLAGAAGERQPREPGAGPGRPDGPQPRQPRCGTAARRRHLHRHDHVAVLQ